MDLRWWLHFFFFTITILLSSCSADAQIITLPKISSFVFGDSLVDSGNNNYIVSLSKANYPPNGIDFGSVTGRFTNGRTIVDIIGQQVGLAGFTPPYLGPTTTGSVILSGVNYASGAGGILHDTGKLFGGRIDMDVQLDNFGNTRQEIVGMIGEDATKELMRRALFSVTMGSNDFINNYLTPVVSAAEQTLVSPQLFEDTMISTFRSQLMRMYGMGARKIVVANVGPIGCIPFQRELNPSAGDNCVAFPNQLARSYNTKLKALVDQLNVDLPDSKFVYANVYDIVNDIIVNYSSYGFENEKSACCYVAGKYGGLLPCGPGSKVCSNRSKYVFWDPYHPSDASNAIIADRLMNGDASVVYPINIRQLVAESS
ncbi:hypothetical protein V2J09_005643 [Rumex salicifolius]